MKTGTACTNPVCAVTTLTTDDDIPWGLVTLPDGTIVYNRRDSHDIIHLNPTTGAKTNLGTVPNVQSTDGEGGLLGLEINPASFASDHWFYIFHTSPSDNRIVRIKYNPATDKIDRVPSRYCCRASCATSSTTVAGCGSARTASTSTPVPVTRRTVPTRRTRTASTARCCASTRTARSRRTTRSATRCGATVTATSQGLAFDSQGRLWEQEFGNSVMDETNLITKGGNYGWPICEGTADGTGQLLAVRVSSRPSTPTRWRPGSCSGIAIVRDVLYVACERGTRMYREVISGSSLTSVTAVLQRHLRPAAHGRAGAGRRHLADHDQQRGQGQHAAQQQRRGDACQPR